MNKGARNKLKASEVKFVASTKSSPESVLKMTAEFGAGVLGDYQNNDLKGDYGVLTPLEKPLTN